VKSRERHTTVERVYGPPDGEAKAKIIFVVPELNTKGIGGVRETRPSEKTNGGKKWSPAEIRGTLSKWGPRKHVAVNRGDSRVARETYNRKRIFTPLQFTGKTGSRIP